MQRPFYIWEGVGCGAIYTESLTTGLTNCVYQQWTVLCA